MDAFREVIARGSTTFDEVRKELMFNGYIIEGWGNVGERMTRSLIRSIEATFQDIHAEVYGTPLPNVRLLGEATDTGAQKGDFREMVYNLNRFSPDQARRMIIAVNTCFETFEKILAEPREDDDGEPE